ncbi:hypothetical protein [Gracilibacillus alcaliphilus]|uniref:hypothetical protein n=1 Tax=Gracilibacillus alcaliphilus TaxID=1401441 RepID=UPI00195AF244|nr:hypothetical protein [Gracilibacillus alcaliphilus]MBM7677048.1 hypothetical protein [Gracilibacillus alcaliphilus]
MKNIKKAAFLFGVSCILMGLIVAPFAFFYVRSGDPVELDRFQAGEEFRIGDRANYVTYRTNDLSISCYNQEGIEITLFQEEESDIVFTSQSFPQRVVCNAEITAYSQPSPQSLRFTSGLLIAAPLFVGVGVWIIRKNRKPKAD